MTPITKPKPGAGTRVEWIDATKGIGIMLVVLAHCWRGLIDSSIMQWNDGLRLLDYGIYSFHMPLFFLLSGLTGGGALYGRRQRYIVTKLKSVAYPYFLWSAIVGLLLMSAGNSAHTRFTWADMVSLPWLPIQQFWFLQALFFSQMLKAAIGCDKPVFVISCCLFLVAAIMPEPEATLAVVFHFSLFFGLGLVCSAIIARLPVIPLSIPALMFLVTIATALATGRHYTDVVFLPAALSGIALCIRFAMALRGTVCGTLLVATGRMSMSIYVMHIIVASGLRIALVKLDFGGGQLAYLGLCVVAGLLVPIAMHLTLERLNLLWLFGPGKQRNVPRTAITS